MTAAGLIQVLASSGTGDNKLVAARSVLTAAESAGRTATVDEVIEALAAVSPGAAVKARAFAFGGNIEDVLLRGNNPR